MRRRTKTKTTAKTMRSMRSASLLLAAAVLALPRRPSLVAARVIYSQNDRVEPHHRHHHRGDVAFRRKVDAALSKVRSLLESTKAPARRVVVIADHGAVDHEYDDKYSLVEFVTNVAVASAANALERLLAGRNGAAGAGAEEESPRDLLVRLSEGLRGKDDDDDGGELERVVLRFEANETCSFVDKRVVETVDGDPKETIETRTVVVAAEGEEAGITTNATTYATTSTRVVREIVEHRWRYELSHELTLTETTTTTRARGAEPTRTTSIQSRSGSEYIVVAGSERDPCGQPSSRAPPNVPREVDLTWLLMHLRATREGAERRLRSRFRVDRDAPSCRTPRRNADLDEASRQFHGLGEWGRWVASYFPNAIASRVPPMPRDCVADRGRRCDLDDADDPFRSVDDSAVFVPVLPLFQKDAAGALLSRSDVDALLGEQCRTVDGALALLDEAFPHPPADGTEEGGEGTGAASAVEARLILLSRHLSSVSTAFAEGIDHVEDMLRSQLHAAVGREIAPGDFDEFVQSYYPRLFKAEYVPESFVYAVRRDANHYPDGQFAIETAADAGSGGGGDAFEPILTSTRRVAEGDRPTVRMPLNAATSVVLEGEQYLHAWIRAEFGGRGGGAGGDGARLVARARQFSSFLLCVGNVVGPGTFRPKHAIVLQNKDEVVIPLLLEQLPTPKEFRDAVRSLSPEQREFAEAFRAMQLESSVFAVAIVQLRPQLENVLELPGESLTKEIKLTQNLLELFIEYQIPPDLLSFDGDAAAAVDDKISRVKENVASVQAMIDEAKERELKEAGLRSNMKAGGENRRGAYRQAASLDDFGADEMMFDEAVPLMADAMPEMMQARAAPRHVRAASNSRMLFSQSPDDGAVEHHLRAGTTAPQKTGTNYPHQEEIEDTAGLGNAIDYSRIAKELDAAFDEFDIDSALRPTKILTRDARWEKNFQRTLLTPREKAFISAEEKKREKDKAFDLLDALSKSGAEPIRHSELHVIVAATHRFDESLIDTVICSNANPIASVERSALIVSSVIHDVPVTDLVIGQGRLSSIGQHSPKLLDMGKHKASDDDEEDVPRDDIEVTPL